MDAVEDAFRQHKAKSPARMSWAFMRGVWRCPTFTRQGRTIIGAKAFHGPVRDGKGWDHLAKAARHKLSTNGKKPGSLSASISNWVIDRTSHSIHRVAQATQMIGSSLTSN
ncbi:hypothetical protein NH8B_3958 [Pseudogulbenkiania sp. NH8B]|nr:hypothetical protein NH8B_3958 [Pseudogulbenkiania sp. NH8B]